MELKIRVVDIHPSTDFLKIIPSDILSMFFICGNISFKIEDIEKNIENKESIIVILDQTNLTANPIKFTLLHNDTNVLGVGQLAPKSNTQWYKINKLKKNSPNLDEIKIKLETIISHCFNNKNINQKNTSKEKKNILNTTSTITKNVKYNRKFPKINHNQLETTIPISSKRKKFFGSQSQKSIDNNLKNENDFNINTLTSIPVQDMDIGLLCEKEKNDDFLIDYLMKQNSRDYLDFDTLFNGKNEFGFSSTVIKTENFKSPASNKYNKYNKYKKSSLDLKNLDLIKNSGLKSKPNFSNSQKFLNKIDMKKFKTIYGFSKVNINNITHTNRHRSQKDNFKQDYITSGNKIQKNRNNISLSTNKFYNTNKFIKRNNNQSNINQKIEEQIIDQKFKEKLINDINIRDNSFIQNNSNNIENNINTRTKNVNMYSDKIVNCINPIEKNLLKMQFNEAQMLSNLEINSSILNMLMKYEKIKNDFFSLYTDKYIKNIKNNCLLKELEFMLQKIFDLQKQYQYISINFQQEYNNYYKKYKNNQKQYILINKMIYKLKDKIMKYVINDERSNLFENITTNVYYNHNTIKRNSDFNLWNNIIENINIFNVISNTKNNSLPQNKNKLTNLFVNICEKHIINLNKLTKGFYINLKNKVNDSMDNTSNKQSTNVDNYSIILEEEPMKHNKTKSIDVKNVNYEKNHSIRNKRGSKSKDNNFKRNNYKNILVKKNNKDDNKNKNVLTTFTNRRFESLEKMSVVNTGPSLQNTNKKKYFNK